MTWRKRTSENPFDSSGHVIAQFLRPLQCPFDPDNLNLAGCDLSGGFAVSVRSQEAALVAGQHAPQDRHRTFLRLGMRTTKADQSLRTMLSGWQSAQVRAHIAQVAVCREDSPFLCSRVFQTVFSVISVIETAHGPAILLDELI